MTIEELELKLVEFEKRLANLEKLLGTDRDPDSIDEELD